MEYVAEAIGTFIFVSVIMIVSTDKSISLVAPIAIVVALLTAIYFTRNSSFSSMNPAVTFGLWLNNRSSVGPNIMPTNKALYYIIAELIGATAAFFWYRANPTLFVP